MVRLLSSRPVGITICVLAGIGLVLGLIQLIRAVDPGQAIMLIVIELGGLFVGARIIREANRLEALEPEPRPSDLR